jgi:two-component system, chemotaxis family, CheB/CheR fusion protein
MIRKFNSILFAAILAVILYFLDTVLFYSLSGHNQGFLDALIAKGSISELYSRLVMVLGILIFGLIAGGKIREVTNEDHNVTERVIRKNSKKIMDYGILSSLSYHLKTPLNAILGFSELLKKHDLATESRETYINHINSSSKYLMLLVNNLAEISRIESEEMQLTKEETYLSKILQDLFSVFLTRIAETGKQNIELVIERDAKNPDIIIKTDPERLYYVLNNLLENALHTTDKGSIRFGYMVNTKGFIEFFIKDTGHGFSQEKLEEIFERYNKFTDNKNIPFDSSVLRLAISKSMIKFLGGNIRAESHPGHGLNIYFTVPYGEIQSLTSESEPGKPIYPEGKLWKDRVVLVVEDVESNYLYLGELFRPTRAHIIRAKNGLESIKLVKSNPKIEIVLMDILMPEMDGYEAARIIKEIRPELPIIAQTAYTFGDGTKSQEEKFFDAYIIKPIWTPQLMQLMERFLH